MRPKSVRTFRFDSLLGSQHTCQWLCRGKTKPGLVHDAPVQKSLIYRLTATFERCEIRWRRFTCSLLRPVRTCLSFWGKRSNSVIQQTVRSGIWRNWRRRKLHLSKTACENRSSESPCLSASNCILHRAKNDFRHQEMDSLVLWSMQHAFMTLNNLWKQK